MRPERVRTSFRPVTTRRVFEEILDQLEEAMHAGELVAGDHLPSERDLAGQLQASRTSVREALRVLEALGVVRVQQGADRGATLLEEPGNAFTYLVKLYLSLNHVSMQSIVDFLIVISCWSAASAARGSGGPRVLDELEAIVAAMREPGLDQLAFHELDAAFHSTVVRASGNELAGLVFEGCSDALRQLILLAIDESEEWDSTRIGLAEEHSEILAALQDGDPEAAEARMRAHLILWCGRAVDEATRKGVNLS
jgi:GntR family transcriptional regulator, transcriptional repressor for pyruvate dehydrogenase complex